MGTFDSNGQVITSSFFGYGITCRIQGLSPLVSSLLAANLGRIVLSGGARASNRVRRGCPPDPTCTVNHAVGGGLLNGVEYTAMPFAIGVMLVVVAARYRPLGSGLSYSYTAPSPPGR